MATFFLYNVRTTCTECGESLVLEGPTLRARCVACQSELDFNADQWKGVLDFRNYASEYNLVEGATRGSSLSSGELKLLIRWGPQRPLCAGCNAPLNLALAPPGTNGAISCACGATTSTFAPPPWLAAAVPDALQLFGAVREGEPQGAQVELRGRERNPISFGCPDCGAKLKISAASPRVVACEYCKADLYLPDPLWRELHPVKKRVPWYVAYR